MFSTRTGATAVRSLGESAAANASRTASDASLTRSRDCVGTRVQMAGPESGKRVLNAGASLLAARSEPIEIRVERREDRDQLLRRERPPSPLDV